MTISVVDDMLSLLLIPILTITVVLSLSISNVNAKTAETIDFSMDIPDNWAYIASHALAVRSTPDEFSDLLLNNTSMFELIKDKGGASAKFNPDLFYNIEDAPFAVYVKYRISEDNAINVTSMQNTTIAGEPAVKIYGDGIESFSGIKWVRYLVWHKDEPYLLDYIATEKDYQKYLPQFEQMVKTLKFLK